MIKEEAEKEDFKIANETEENQIEIQTIELNEEENEHDHCTPCSIRGNSSKIKSAIHLSDDDEDDCNDIFDYILCNQQSSDKKE